MEITDRSYDKVFDLDKTLKTDEDKRISLQNQKIKTLNELKNILFGSIEETKSKLASVLTQYIGSKNTRSIRDVCLILRSINSVILHIIEEKRSKISLLNSVETEKNNLDRIDIDSDTKANEAIKGLIKLITQDDPDNAELLYYLNSGLDGLEKIAQRLKDLEAVDSESLKRSGLIVESLANLEKNIISQQALIDQVFPKRSFLQKILHKDVPNDMFGKIGELVTLISKEITTDNKYLRYCYEMTDIKSENEDITNIRWLEEKQVKLDDDLKLLFRMFLIPKVPFTSGNYSTFVSSENDSMRIFDEKSINNDSIKTKKSQFRIGSLHRNLFYVPYRVNTTDQSENRCGFLMPIEAVMEGHYFITRKDNTEIMIYDKPHEDNDLIKMVQDDAKIFDLILQDIEDCFVEWGKEAKSIQHDFRRNWAPAARKIIIKDFTKRWVNEQAPIFRDKLHSLFDVVDFMTDTLWFASISEDELKAEQAKGYEQDFIKPKDFIEEVYRMDKPQFIDLVKRSKAFYNTIIPDAVKFLKEARLDIPIINMVFVAPRAKVLFWEKYFEKINYRPRVYYYKAKSIGDGMKEAFEKCNATEAAKDVKRPKDTRIFNSPFKALQII